MIPVPTDALERSLHDAGARYVIGCDEVGRGALAGPVAVGMTVVDATVGAFPEGLRDSKLLPEPKRELLAPLCASWVRFSAVGLASPAEVDELGIIACLGLAGARAVTTLCAAGVDVDRAHVVLDGNHDYLTPAISDHATTALPVMTRIKADQSCASVAAASVIAKVHRDRLMIDADAVTVGYGWAENKGYGSPRHLEAIRTLGPSEFHRRTWLKNLAA